MIPVDEEFEDRDKVTQEFQQKVIALGDQYAEAAEERVDEPSEESD